MMNAPRTLPTFPNAINDLILYQLPPEDLLAVYLASRACRDFVNNNDQIQKKMFRLPKSLDSASRQVRAAHIQQLWQDVYDRMNRNELTLKCWSHIRVNPFIRAYPQSVDSHRMNSPDYFEDTYEVDSQSLTFLSTYPPPNCLSFVPDEKKVLTSLIDTMFITYPPICRIQILKLRKPRLAPYPPAPEVMFLEREGHTVKGAFQIMSDPRYVHEHRGEYRSRLWPEKFWRHLHGLISESEDDEDEWEEEDNEDEEEQEDDGIDSDYEPDDSAASDSE
jgi:hypothetical protein